MTEKADWLEVNDHGDHVTIHGQDASYHITKFGLRDWQIGIEAESGGGTYGTVDSKQDAINYVFEKAGIIENGGVTPSKVVIT